MSRANPVAVYAIHKDAEAFAQTVSQYQRFVLATCRRQLRNPADVDDAVQETFLRLAQRAAELQTNIGAWLHTCAINISIDMNRRRAARHRHEASTAAIPKPDADAQRTLTELREHLDAALQLLDADSRELIVERFFLGRSQVDMAADANVAPSTISHRLNAAIETLREHLQKLGCAALTAGGVGSLIAAMQAEHASAAVPSALTGNLMKIGLSGVGKTAGIAAGLKLIMAALALFVSGLGVWLVMGQTGQSRGQFVPATAPATITVRSGQNEGATPPDWKKTQAAAQWAVLAGRIVDSAGQPVAAASIQLDGPERQTGKSDAQGNYSFPQLRQGGDYRVTVRAPGFITVDPYLSREPALQLSPDAQARRDYVLERGVNLKVLATDVVGQPMKNVSIYINRSGDRYHYSGLIRKETDKDGAAEFTLPISKDLYLVAATMDGYGPEHDTIHAKSADVPLEVQLTLQKSLNIRGVAICADQKPAAGWSIYAEPEWWASNYLPKSSPIDKDGNFTLTNVGPGLYSIWLSRGNSSQSITTMTFPPATQPMRIDLPMPSPSSMVTVTGKFRFTGGQPEQLRVSVRSLSGDREFLDANLKFGPSGKGTDRLARNEGEYTFTAPPGPYAIQFESPFIKAASLDKIELPGKLPLVTLNVVGKPHLTGTVTNAANKEPITHFAVRVRKWETLGKGPNYGQDLEWTQVSEAKGHFDMQCVSPGVYQVQISAGGYAWLWSPKVRLEEGHMTQDLQLSLTNGGSLAGTIVDPDGKPVPSAKVIPLSMARTVAMGYEDRFGSDAGAVTTDASGKFLLPHLDPGDETLKIVDPHFAPLITSKLKITEATTTNAGVFVLHPGGTVEGVVRDNSGNPVPGVAVQFQDSSGYGGGDDEIAGRLASAATGANGRYRVEHLPEQVLWVNLADRWSRSGVVRRVVRPLPGKTAHLDFGGTTPVTGRLSFAGHPYASKRIELSVQSQYFGSVVVAGSTDSQGNFTFVGPPPGHYTLYCQAPERESDWIALRKVEVGDQPLDLGQLVLDVGDLIIHITADDPALASSVQYVSVNGDIPKRTFQESIAQAGPEGDHWKARGVPAGHFKVTAYLKDSIASGVNYGAPVDRKAGAPETPVTLHLPKSTATLKLINTHGSKETSNHKSYLMLRNENASVTAGLVFAEDSTATVKLPAGVYRVIDPSIDQPRQDMDPIVLKEGDSQERRADFSKPDPNSPMEVNLQIWSSDGVLVTSPQPRLLDAQGNPVDSWGNSYLGTLFMVHPGQYKAVINSAGATPFTKEIDLPPAAPTENGTQWNSFDIVLPQ